MGQGVLQDDGGGSVGERQAVSGGAEHSPQLRELVQVELDRGEADGVGLARQVGSTDRVAKGSRLDDTLDLLSRDHRASVEPCCNIPQHPFGR